MNTTTKTPADFGATAATTSIPAPRPWDARLGRWLVTPLKDTWVHPNHLTTLRLMVGLAGAAALCAGSWGWSNVGAALVVLSNFLDHTDGELARISGRSSRFGHLYDLACDALVTILLFVCLGVGLGAAATRSMPLHLPAAVLGAGAGCAVALIFYLRMQIEDMVGKGGTRQGAWAGFETEDVLYLLPVVTLMGITAPFLVAAAIGAPAFAVLVVIDWLRVRVRQRSRRR